MRLNIGQKVWTTNMTAVFMVLCTYQLILATSAQHERVVTGTTNNAKSEQTLVSGNTTPQLEAKMIKMQNGIQELYDRTDNAISDRWSMKERLNILERKVEILQRVYDDNQEVKKDQKDLEIKFYEAMLARNITRAAIYLNIINSNKGSINYLKHGDEILNNIDCYMRLTKLLDYDQKLQIYSILQDLLLQKIESYADICYLAPVWLNMANLTFENRNALKLFKFDSKVNNKAFSDIVDDIKLERRIDSKKCIANHHIDGLLMEYIETNLSNLLQPLLMRSNHIPVYMLSPRDYAYSDLYFSPRSQNVQVLYCRDLGLELRRDEYRAPLQYCKTNLYPDLQ